MNDVSEIEKQNAASRALNEVQALTLGRNNVNIHEVYDLREHARKRAAINKAKSELNPDELIWRGVFEGAEELIEKNLDPDKKAEIDNLRYKFDAAKNAEQIIPEIANIGRDIEKKLMMQHGMIAFNFNAEENTYRLAERAVSTEMLKPEISDMAAIAQANKLLELVKIYRETVVIPLLNLQDEIYTSLTSFERKVEELQLDVVFEADHEFSRTLQNIKRWLILTKELYSNRALAVSAIKNQIEIDEVIPNHLIKNGGDRSINLPLSEFGEKMVSVSVFVKQASEEEDRIDIERNPLSKELYGDPETYMDLLKSGDNQTAMTSNNQQQNKLEEKTWYRLAKVIYIVLCIFGALFSFAVLSEGSDIAIWAVIITAAVLYGIRRAFLYIMVGNNK